MKSYSRINRVEALITHTLAEMVNREWHDLHGEQPTITHVTVSKDLSIAKVYLLIHDETKIKSTLDSLKKSAKFFRGQLARSINLRRTPELHFYYDQAIGQGLKISSLLVEESQKSRTDTEEE